MINTSLQFYARHSEVSNIFIMMHGFNDSHIAPFNDIGYKFTKKNKQMLLSHHKKVTAVDDGRTL